MLRPSDSPPKYRKHRATGQAVVTLSAADFGPRALKAVRNTMIEADLAITTINQHAGRIRRMFRWGVADCAPPPNTARVV